MVAFAHQPLKEKVFVISDEDEMQAMADEQKRQRRCFLIKAVLAMFVIMSVFVYITFFDQGDERMQWDSYSPEMNSASLPYADRFIAFMAKHNREYDRNETMIRFQEYENSLRVIEQLNAERKHNAFYGENGLSDWSDEEFKKMLLPMDFYKKLHKEATFIKKNPPAFERSSPLPDHFDWRDKKVISPVKAQGQCGSCWAFAATATVEAAYAISHGQMRNLSEQTLLDCDLDDNACDGGDEDKAFRYIHRNGLAFADDLPYVAHRQESCSVTAKSNTTKIDVAYFLHPDEKSMMDWLVNFGPVNIGISVTSTMKPYTGGVFSPTADACKNDVIGLHALMIVGYGTSEKGEKYWIVKNSWGNTWGIEHGYVYFARGVNACGIEDEPIGILA